MFRKGADIFVRSHCRRRAEGHAVRFSRSKHLRFSQDIELLLERDVILLRPRRTRLDELRSECFLGEQYPVVGERFLGQFADVLKMDRDPLARFHFETGDVELHEIVAGDFNGLRRCNLARAAEQHDRECGPAESYVLHPALRSQSNGALSSTSYHARSLRFNLRQTTALVRAKSKSSPDRSRDPAGLQ